MGFRLHSMVVLLAFVVALLFPYAAVRGQEAVVTAQVEISGLKPAKQSSGSRDFSNVVIWLTPADGRTLPKTAEAKGPTPTITQQNKSFSPHILVVQVGTAVLFPNRDRFLHNVFSLHEGKQFDLGFYEAGSAKSVRFDRPGVSYLFCNIHPEMTAAVVAVETPYFALSDAVGRVTIAGVAEGKYRLHVWSEQSVTEDLKKLEREVTIVTGNSNLGVIAVEANPNFNAAHKNKYGQDYVPPATADYSRP
jgi:plastocyanin